jgi:hypothetical protein
VERATPEEIKKFFTPLGRTSSAVVVR